MNPVIGSHVLYKLDAGDVGAIERRRAASPAPAGHMLGNFVSVGQVFPAFAVADFSGGTYLNLQVLLDGIDSHWATSRQRGDGLGQWSWPPLPEGVELIAGSVSRTAPAVGDAVHYVSYGTPGGEYGKECRAAMITELTEVEVNEQNPAGDGTYRQAAGLFVASPSGTFHNRGVLFASGTFAGPAREAVPGEPLPVITCADLEFPGGTWHWPGDA